MRSNHRGLNLILLGPPGSGKGTQAKVLAKSYNVPHISTGDILHDVVEKGSALGQEAGRIIGCGGLVPDRLVDGIILQRLHREDCARGFLLDGYPRNIAQAGILDGVLAELGRSIERVIFVAVPDEVITKRLQGRRVHKPSGRTYHVDFDPPKVVGIDDESGEPLVERADDREQVVRERLRVYYQDTAVLIDLYEARGQLLTVDGNRPKDAVTDAVMAAVGAPVGV
ncbi:MAG: adenylate kinase [bacterium]|nr:adenylate kinase [bacterium]